MKEFNSLLHEVLKEFNSLLHEVMKEFNSLLSCLKSIPAREKGQRELHEVMKQVNSLARLAKLRNPLKSLEHRSRILLRGLRGALNWASIEPRAVSFSILEIYKIYICIVNIS